MVITQTYQLQLVTIFIILYSRKGFSRSDEHLYRVLDECTKSIGLLATIQRKHTEIGTEIENESVAS